MNSHTHLVKLEKELSYLFWRAEVHRFSVEEIEGSVDALRARLLDERMSKAKQDEEVERLLRRHNKTLSGLVARAAHYPPSGLVG